MLAKASENARTEEGLCLPPAALGELVELRLRSRELARQGLETAFKIGDEIWRSSFSLLVVNSSQ